MYQNISRQKPINVYSDYMVTSLTPFRKQSIVTIYGLLDLPPLNELEDAPFRPVCFSSEQGRFT